MPVRYERVLVTKPFARKLLEANVEYNRNKKPAKVQAYKQDMNNGDWDTETGETIKVTKDGKLIDGQNRMQAFLESKLKELYFDIAYDVPEKSFDVIDTGASRTFADTLRKEHVAGERFVNGAVVRRVWLWDKGIRAYKGGGTNKQNRPTHPALKKFWRVDPGGFEAASRRGADISRAKMGQAGIAGTAFYLFARVDKDQANNFFEAVITGANLPEKHPALWLGQKLRRDRMFLLPEEQLILWIKAWNLYRKDELVDRTLSIKGFRGEEYTNETFPTPV